MPRFLKKTLLLFSCCSLLLSALPAKAGVIAFDDEVVEKSRNENEDQDEQEQKTKKRRRPKMAIHLSLESSDPIPFRMDRLDKSSEKISWGNLNYGGIKFIDGGQLGFGTQFLDGYTELAIHIGFRMVKGDFVPGSVSLINQNLSSYQAFIVPVRVLLRFAPFKWRAKPYGGLFVGLNPGSLHFYDDRGRDTNQIIMQVAAGLRAGVDIDIVKNIGFGLYFEGELTNKQEVPGSAPLSNSGLRAGLTLYYHFRVQQTNIEKMDEDDDMITQSYKNMTEAEQRRKIEEEERLKKEKMQKQFDVAFDEIKLGDMNRFKRQCAEAVVHYQKGLALLPDDKQTSINVGVPVRIDLAGCFVDLDRIPEAVKVLREAYLIDPDNMQVVNSLEVLSDGMEFESVPVITDNKEQQAPNSDKGHTNDDLAPIEILDGE